MEVQICYTLNRNSPTGGLAYGIPWKLTYLTPSQPLLWRP